MEPRPAGSNPDTVTGGDMMALVDGAKTLQDAISLAQEAAAEMVIRAARRLAEQGDAEAKAFLLDMAAEGFRQRAAAFLAERGLLPDNVVDFPVTRRGRED